MGVCWNKVAHTEHSSENKSTCRTDGISGNQQPWFLNLPLALQLVLVQSSLLVLVVGLLQQHLALQDGEREKLLASMLFYSSLSTLLQSCLGTCLPLVQAPSLEVLIPAVLLSVHMTTEPDCRGSCEESEEDFHATAMRELQGMTLTVGVVHLVLGVTGFPGLVLRHCGPLVVAPLLCMLGFSIYKDSALLCSDHWAIAALTILLLVFLSQHLRSYMFPVCLRLPQIPVCRMLSILLPLLSVWGVCATLEHLGYIHLYSVSELLPTVRMSNTSLLLPVIYPNTSVNVQWLSLPLTGEAGRPLLSVPGITTGVVAALSSSISSMGVYLLTARLLKAPPPPATVCNRGLSAEGLGNVLAALMGAPLAVSSSVPNACALGLSQHGSRLTVQLAATMGLILGVSPRLTQFFTSVPLAIYGAILSVTYAVAVATGVMYFKFTDIDSGRNIFNIGFTVFMSLVLPRWFNLQNGFIDTGVAGVNVLLQSVLTSPVLLVGLMAFVLDNTVSGSQSERGLDCDEMRKGGWTPVNSEQGYHQQMDVVYEAPYLMRRLFDLPGCPSVLCYACRTRDHGEVL